MSVFSSPSCLWPLFSANWLTEPLCSLMWHKIIRSLLKKMSSMWTVHTSSSVIVITTNITKQRGRLPKYVCKGKGCKVLTSRHLWEYVKVSTCTIKLYNNRTLHKTCILVRRNSTTRQRRRENKRPVVCW